MAQLRDAVNPDIDVLITADFTVEKQRILNDTKERIVKHSHPTVWKEMIRQRADLPTAGRLFSQMPAALRW